MCAGYAGRRLAWIQPDLDAGPVGGQPFAFGQGLDVRRGRGECLAGVYSITLVRRRKSFAHSPLANLAVPPVGNTCDGPAT